MIVVADTSPLNYLIQIGCESGHLYRRNKEKAGPPAGMKTRVTVGRSCDNAGRDGEQGEHLAFENFGHSRAAFRRAVHTWLADHRMGHPEVARNGCITLADHQRLS